MNDGIVQFPNRHGQQLSGRLEQTVDRAPVAYALFAHCFTCSKDLKAVGEIVKALGRAGVATLRFDFTGLGDSEGAFVDTSLSRNVEDLLDAAAFLKERYAAPRLLIGHSFGGAAVLQAAGDLPEVRAVATIAAPFDPSHVSDVVEGGRDAVMEKGEATVTIGGRSFRLRREFFDDLAETSVRERLRGLRRPLLILHSPTDNVVGIDNARLLFEAALHPKSFVSLDDADHLLTSAGDARYAGEIIAGWAARYIGRPEAPSWQQDVHDNRTVVLTERGLRTEAMTNGFGMVLDEPVSVGGTGTGPSPYDLLSTALAACTSMTLRLYADRKEWPLDAVRVDVRHKKVHVEDCENCDKPSARIDMFERQIYAFGPLDEPQRQRLLEIADRCPVHRTLTSEVRVSTTMPDASMLDRAMLDGAMPDASTTAAAVTEDNGRVGARPADR